MAAILFWWITQPAAAVVSILPSAGRAVASSPRAAPPAPSGRKTIRSLSAPPTTPLLLTPPQRTAAAAPPPPASPPRRGHPPHAPSPPTPAAAGPPREKELRLPRHPPEECLAAELGPPAPPQSRAAGLLAQEAGAAGGLALPRGMAAGRRPGNDTRRPSYDLVILILSSRRAELSPEKRRAAVRRTWLRGAAELGAPGGAPSRCAVRHLFVIGGARRERLGGAGDLLMLPVDDGYRSLSHKVLGGLRWSARHLSFKYLFKTDDDSFVCLARLLELLRPLTRAGLYLGYQNKNHSIVTKASIDEAEGRYAQWEDETYVRVFGGESPACGAPREEGRRPPSTSPALARRRRVRSVHAGRWLRALVRPRRPRVAPSLGAPGGAPQPHRLSEDRPYPAPASADPSDGRRAHRRAGGSECERGAPQAERIPLSEPRRLRAAGESEPAARSPPPSDPARESASPLQVCESDTEFVLVHKLSLDELAGCRKATVRRRSARCPRGPCECRSLGVTPKLKRKVLPPPRGGAAAGASKGRKLLQLGRGPAQRQRGGRAGPPLDGGRG